MNNRIKITEIKIGSISCLTSQPHIYHVIYDISVILNRNLNWLIYCSSLVCIAGRWCRRDWSTPPDPRAQDASRRIYSQVFLGSPGMLSECKYRFNWIYFCFVLSLHIDWTRVIIYMYSAGSGVNLFITVVRQIFPARNIKLSQHSNKVEKKFSSSYTFFYSESKRPTHHDGANLTPHCHWNLFVCYWTRIYRFFRYWKCTMKNPFGFLERLRCCKKCFCIKWSKLL